ncbi:MAG: glutathione S-transferase family protein [Burkholderiales bacterium]
MLKIYGQARSRTFRVLWMANELGLAYEHIPVSIHVDNAGAKEDWYVKLNPHARIPTIDDDGTIVWESAAINIYLARKYGQGKLWPKTIAEEGNMLKWAFFVTNDIEPHMVLMFQNRVALPPEKRNALLADESEKKLVPGLKALDKQLTNTAYLSGSEWGLADCIASSIVYTLFAIKYDLSAYPKLASWLAYSVGRPAALVARKLRE